MSKRSKLASKIIVGITILIIIGYTFATPSDFADFEGSTHTGCHGTNPISPTGYIELNSSTGSNLLPGQVFTLSVQVKSFTEGSSKSVSIGFALGNPGRGDNRKFSFNPAIYDDISIDGSGNSGILSFQVTAPSSFGSYTLVADSLEGGEGSGSYAFEWTSGTIDLLVGFPSVTGAPILENLTSTAGILELGNSQSIQIDAVDNETSVDEIFIEYNNANHSLIPTIGNTYVYQNWTPSSVGQKQYVIYAFDTENKLSGAGGSFIVEDTVFPIYSNYIKSSDTVEAGETANIQISATDLAGIKEISIEIDGVLHPMAYVGNDTWSYELRTPYQGSTIDYSIKIEDNSGNLVTLEDSFQITGGITGSPSELNDLMIIVFGSLTGILSISFIGIALKKRKHFF
ncbi:MAG: hypothetical protein ACW98X_03650 [Promethearchaeota archaeon]|jgi:hypothetical protein